MADNPLVATAPQTSWTGTANMKPMTSFSNAGTDFEGAGLFSDAASTLSDATTAQGWTSGAAEMDIAGDAMDAIGVAMDPFGSLLGAGIGWLIEHIGFLKKPLDYLAGDPEEITAKQQTWENIAKALNDAATQYQQSAQTMAGNNQGAAVDGAHASGNNFANVLTGAAGHATDAANAMKVAGTVVGTTRGMIRDSLSQFAGDAIVKWIAATALAFFSFGATEAAFVVDEVAEGASLAAENGGKVSKVVSFLEKLKGGAKDSSEALDKATESIAKDAGTDAAKTAGEDAGKTAAKDAGKTRPNDTGETTTTSSAGDTGATHTDTGQTRPAETGESTSPSSATDTSTPTTTHEGDTAPSEPHETTPSESTPPEHADTTTPSSEKPTKPADPTLEEKVEQHKQAMDDHNAQVAQHNTDAADFRKQSAEHNQKAVENEQAMAANKHARDMNQQAINRARAEGKPHDDLKAQHRQLEDQHKQLRDEDTRLSNEQKQLESRHEELNKNAADINKNAEHLREHQAELKKEMGKEWVEKHGLSNENVMNNKLGDGLRKYSENFGDDAHGLHRLEDYSPKEMANPDNWKPSNLLHHGVPGVPKPSWADAALTAKEAGKQWFAEQPSREQNIAEEYRHHLEEMDKAGGEQHAWPTSEQGG